MEGTTSCFLLLIGLILATLYKYLSSKQGNNGIPGPKAYPVVGSALNLIQGPIYSICYDFARQYGKLFKIQVFGMKCIVINTADAVTKAFCADGHKQVFNNRPAIFIADHIYLHGSIIFSNPTKLHGNLRRMLSKGLQCCVDGNPQFEMNMKGEIHRLLDEMRNAGENGFEVVSLVRRSFCSVISILLIGEEVHDTDVTDFYVIRGQDVLGSPLHNAILRNIPFVLKIPYYKARFEKVMMARQRIVEKYFFTVKETKAHGSLRGLVDWYLEEQQKDKEKGRTELINERVITANLLDIISAGIVSTATVIANVILCLVNHPEYQTKIQQELDEVIGASREPTINDKHRCHFLEAVVMETLRYLPPAPLSLPHVCAEDTEFEGFHIESNTQILANIWYIQHDEEVWGDPWVFRPERFLDEDDDLLPNTHPTMKSWMPFGSGQRKCPGMTLGSSSVFLYLACLFQKWNLIPSPEKCRSCDPRRGDFDCDLLLQPKPFHCIAKSRNLP